jgi:hypothetical protein
MVMGFNQHQFGLVLGEKFLDGLICLVVQDVLSDHMPFGFKNFILLLVCHRDDFVAETADGEGQDCICLVVIDHEKADVAIEGLEWKQPSEVVVQCPCVFVSKCGKKNRLALGGLSSLSMILAMRCTDELEGVSPCMAPYAGPGYSYGSWKIGSTGCYNQGDGLGLVGLVRMLRMPWCGHFICPFAVAELGFRYLATPFAVRLWHPLR